MWVAFVLSLQLLTGTDFPSGSMTSWMTPRAFHLEIGMERGAVENAVKRFGWKSMPGRYPRQMIIRYADTKTVTLQFVDDRLQSIRFELVDFIPQIKVACEERLGSIEKELGYKGERQKSDRMVLLFDQKVPNVMVVMSTKTDDEFGRKGLGFLAVRYYDPSAERIY